MTLLSKGFLFENICYLIFHGLTIMTIYIIMKVNEKIVMGKTSIDEKGD